MQLSLEIEMEEDAMNSPEVKLRSYQQEMLEASLERNVIVVMDTGSGKTHVAIERIRFELERTSPEKLVWFVAPSVELCMQQFKKLNENLPAYLIRTLTGQDGVDTWTDQTIWHAVLQNIRVVVGTPKVLEDALTHGFVRISRIALLVFDEAHRCTGNSPMNVIMRNFYHYGKANKVEIPHILGLTASPVMSAKSDTLETIEANLDAVAITPKQHRSELDKFVHPPKVICVTYAATPICALGTNSPMCNALKHELDSYDLSTDPYWMEDGGWRRKDSVHILEKPRTYCYKQLKALQQRSQVLLEQLGTFAAEWFVSRCVHRFIQGLGAVALPELNDKEREHLAIILGRVLSQSPDVPALDGERSFVDKVRSLLEVLMQSQSSDVRGIIFVEQRAVTIALGNLLRSHPHIGQAYGIGTFVGTSTFASRKQSIADITDPKQQQQDLEDFRSGKKNLIIATNALEEGIDVAACNLVICFDLPKNLISYVQRRGRARQSLSQYAVLLPSDDIKSNPSKWQDLEKQMKQAYMKDRDLVPSDDEQEDDIGSKDYIIPKTGARLTLNNAKAHLFHFCAVSSHHESRYVDPRPEFDTTRNGGPKPLTSRVTLPSFVHPSLRIALSSQSYINEATAIKDASFEAYVGLHKAGLVNDNLLPKVRDFGPEVSDRHIEQPSIVEVSERQSSWVEHFRGIDYNCAPWQPGVLTIMRSGDPFLATTIWLPTSVPSSSSFELFWNQETTYNITIRPPSDSETVDDWIGPGVLPFTHVMLNLIYGAHMPASESAQYPVLFSPWTLDLTDSQAISNMVGQQPAPMLLEGNFDLKQAGLVRVNGQMNRAYFYVVVEDQAGHDDETQLVVTAFPRRKDFLHPLFDVNNQTTSYVSRQRFPIGDCTIDNLPAEYAILAAFVPSIMHRLDTALLARHLQESLLDSVGISDLSLIEQAITAPAALERLDYNRLEFLGDTILKLCAVLQVMAEHLNWPERYLTLKKSNLVSNTKLSQAVTDLGLARYIINKPFTGSKWRPVYVDELLHAGEGNRMMSTKVIADVAEALIGAAFVDGGLDKGIACIQTLLPEETWYDHDQSINLLLQELDTGCDHPGLALLEQLIGHHFTRSELLVEAMTHASYPNTRASPSYERLEFLGDAVLDLLVVPKLFAHPRKLKHWELHRVREALVNGHFLAYHCMSLGIAQESYDAVTEGQCSKLLPPLETSVKKIHLHDFLRMAPQLLQHKRQAVEAFETFRKDIDHRFEREDEYPWPELLAMNAPKFLSDIVESVLGALYLDTRGDLKICETFIEKLGIADAMWRILDFNIETAFPKEQLGILADKQSVEYTTTMYQAEAGGNSFTCTTEVAGLNVASVDGCRSRDEAEARCARQAARILESTTAVQSNNRKRKLDLVSKHQAALDDAEDIEGLEEEDGGVGL